MTALHMAAGEGHVVRALVEIGACKQAKAYEDSTPLHLATLCGRLEAVSVLAELGERVH